MNRQALREEVARLIVATAEGSDPEVDSAVPRLLRELRRELGMDAVFVSEFSGGRRHFRFVDATAEAPPIAVGASDPLEDSYCQRVVDGRLPGLVHDAASLPPGRVPPTPFRVGAHLSTPVVLKDGRTYGTLCTFSTSPNPLLQESDLTQLRQYAELVANRVDRGSALSKPPSEWQLEPIEEDRMSSAFRR